MSDFTDDIYFVHNKKKNDIYIYIFFLIESMKLSL